MQKEKKHTHSTTITSSVRSFKNFKENSVKPSENKRVYLRAVNEIRVEQMFIVFVQLFNNFARGMTEKKLC